MQIVLIAALAKKNRVIGSKNKIPWRIPEDFKQFREKTLGQTLIMGRKTFESIGRPLPGRKTILLSRTRDEQLFYRLPELGYASSLQDALTQSSKVSGKVFICGGQKVYEEALPLATNLVLSFIEGDFEGDTFFPDFSPADFVIEREESFQQAFVPFSVVHFKKSSC